MSKFENDKIDPSVLKLQTVSNKVHLRTILVILILEAAIEIYILFNIEKFGVFATSLRRITTLMILLVPLRGIYTNEKKRK